MKSLTSLDICHLTKLVDKVCRCRPVKTLHEDCIFKCNPLWSLQPVQLTQERSVMCWNAAIHTLSDKENDLEGDSLTYVKPVKSWRRIDVVTFFGSCLQRIATVLCTGRLILQDWTTTDKGQHQTTTAQGKPCREMPTPKPLRNLPLRSALNCDTSARIFSQTSHVQLLSLARHDGVQHWESRIRKRRENGVKSFIINFHRSDLTMHRTNGL